MGDYGVERDLQPLEPWPHVAAGGLWLLLGRARHTPQAMGNAWGSSGAAVDCRPWPGRREAIVAHVLRRTEPAGWQDSCSVGMQGVGMWRSTYAWPCALVALLLASACGRGSPTSPSFGSYFLDCHIKAHGAMTATLDGAPWIPVSTRATQNGVSTIRLAGSDCTHVLSISLTQFTGLGTYDVAAGGVGAELQCDSQDCGLWRAGQSTDSAGKAVVIGSGAVTVTAYSPPTPGVEGSGAIEGTFAFTLVANTGLGGPTVTRALTNGRFGTRFWLVGS